MPPKRKAAAASGVSSKSPTGATRKPCSTGPRSKRLKKASAFTKSTNGQQRVQAATFPRRSGEVARLPPADPMSSNDSIVNRHEIVALSDVSEQLVMSFLSFMPDRLRVERVCKRWRRLSQQDVPIHEMDLSKGIRSNATKHDFIRVLQRANGQLIRLVLPDSRIDDSYFREVVNQKNLRFFRAHRLQRKHILELLKCSTQLESMELLDCQGLQLAGLNRPGNVQLRKIYLNGCDSLSNQAACSLIEMCGVRLKRFIIIGAASVDSQIFPFLADHAIGLQELTMSHCQLVRMSDLTSLISGLWETLSWLDLSLCGGINSFPESPVLPRLQVLVLNKTRVNDDGLRAISRLAPNLKYLSLQDCRSISDEGISAIASAEGCANLELIDLKGTSVTDMSIRALEKACLYLRMVRVDSCRSVSREKRAEYNERARELYHRGELNEYERISLRKKEIIVTDDESSDSSDKEVFVGGEVDSSSDAMADSKLSDSGDDYSDSDSEASES